jgi:hypothetical protein
MLLYVTRPEGARARKTYHHKPQRLGMINEPTSNKQPHSEEDGDNSQPVSPRPPKRQQKAARKDEAGDLARNDVEATEDEQSANDGRAEVAGRQRDEAFAALHVRHAALVWVELDGDHLASGAACRNGVAELVEGDHEHLHAWSVPIIPAQRGEVARSECRDPSTAPGKSIATTQGKLDLP